MVTDSYAQPKPGRFSLRGMAGIGYLPMDAWGDFFSSASDNYHKDRFGLYWDVGVVYCITERHSIALTVGIIEISASCHERNSFFSSAIEWDHRTIPIGLSYEYYLTSLNRWFSPFTGFTGLGVSYLLSEVESRSVFVEPLYGRTTEQGKRTGEGYGFHAYFGIQSQLTPHVHFISRLRGRYADGMGFTDNKGDIKVEFTGIDLMLGLGWRLWVQ